MKQKTKAPRPKFKMQPMTNLEKKAAKKAKIAKMPMDPNRNSYMCGGTSI